MQLENWCITLGVPRLQLIQSGRQLHLILGPYPFGAVMSGEKMSTWPYAQWYCRSDISQMGALNIKLGGWNLYGSALLALWLLCGCEVRAFCSNINSWPTRHLLAPWVLVSWDCE